MKGKDGRELNPREASADQIYAALISGGGSLSDALGFIELVIWDMENEKLPKARIIDNELNNGSPKICRQNDGAVDPSLVIKTNEDSVVSEIAKLKELRELLKNNPPPSIEAKAKSVLMLNFRGELKTLAVALSQLEELGFDRLTDKQAAELITLNGVPVKPNSLKTVRNRDL